MTTLKNEAQTTAVGPPARRTRSANLILVRKIWPWVFLILMVAFFTVTAKVMNNTDFLSVRSIQGILDYSTQILLLALGETYIIIAAGIDLSVGYMLGFAAVIAASIMQILFAAGAPPFWTVTAGMLGGVLASMIPGWVNGVLVAKVKVPPFISTLGLGYAVFGVALLISGGYPVAKQPPFLGQVGNGSVIYYWKGHGINFFKMPAGATGGEVVPLISNLVFVTLIVTLIAWFVLSKTQFGQHLYAIGGNFEAAVRAGIPVERTLTWVYIIAGLLSGVAGSLWAARFTSGAADAGVASLLMSIAAVVIGGASLFGGEGTVIGTIVGSLIIATIQFGLVVLGMKPFWQYAVVGLVVIVAVIVDQFGRTLER